MTKKDINIFLMLPSHKLIMTLFLIYIFTRMLNFYFIESVISYL